MNTATRLFFLLAVLLAGPASAATITITVGDNFYSPQFVTIQPGDVVTWQYATGANATHPTASDNNTWTTFTINSANPTKSLTFNAAGSFPYHCTFHGGPGVGMYGTITVAVATPVRAAELATAAFRLYPNPVADYATIQLTNHAAKARYSVELINTLGQAVRTRYLQPAGPNATLPVDFSGLPAGTYVYRLLADGKLLGTQRVVVVH